VATCAAHGVTAARRDSHPGCWCDPDGARPRKIGALGLRVERGVTYHGIALNVTVDLADFGLIDACGMPGVVSTSIAAERGERDATPSTESVARAASVFARALAEAIEAPLAGELPA
jgi:lipoyl(octanoyl) transferase